jgi:transcriptional regulator with XRE-family HTH domain
VSDLGNFLRARREQLQPGEVGLPGNIGRRRTPGLRREEVATLAGVSIDYLVRLEQGRDVNPSTDVLIALSIALRLSDDERAHLLKLAARGSAPTLCPAGGAAVRVVAPTVQALLDRLVSTPAFVLGPFTDVLARNRAWERVAGPLGILDSDPPNFARYVLTHPRAPEVFADWNDVADDQVAQLRAASARWADDPELVALLDDLRSLPAFASRWPRHRVERKRRGVKRFAHPTAGELRVAFEVLLLPDDGDQRLLTWLPADEITAVALATLVGEPLPTSPARLRVVGES